MVLTWKAWLRLGFALLKGCRDWRPTTITQLVPLESLPPQQRVGGIPDGYRVQVRMRQHVGLATRKDPAHPSGVPQVEVRLVRKAADAKDVEHT